MSHVLRNTYSHRRRDRKSSPVPQFDQVFGMGKPVLRDLEQAIDLSVKKVEVETAGTSKTSANKDPVKMKSTSSDDDDMIDLLDEVASSCSDTNVEDISDRELSLIRAHMSNIDSEDARYSSQSLTVTYVLTSATDSSSSATDRLQPVELPRQTAADISKLDVHSLVNLSVDGVQEDDKGYESPQEVFDLSVSVLDNDEIRSSTPVNNSQIQLLLFDSLSTIAELQNNKERNEEDEAKVAEIMADYEEDDDEDDEEDEQEEEESFSYVAQNEMTPPRPSKQCTCPSISLKRSLRCRKKDNGKKLRSLRCIFPEEGMQEQVLETQSLKLTQQAKELIDNRLGIRQLTSTPISFRGNQSHNCLPHPAVSTIKILEPHHCIYSTELESAIEVGEPEALMTTRIQETLHEQPCHSPVAESSSEGRITLTSDCGRQAKRCRISKAETDLPETFKNRNLYNAPVLKPAYMVGPNRWNIPYKTTEGEICEHKDLELCSIIRLPYVEENPVSLLQCLVDNNEANSYSPDFLESF